MRYLLVIAITLALMPTTISAHELHPGVPIPFGAGGSSRTELVMLEGTYAVDWTANPKSSMALTITLVPLDGMTPPTVLAAELLRQPEQRRTHLYTLPPGHYYLDVTATGPWTATLTPLTP